ncbi:metal-dependent transcriptional regulator [Sedimentisphaera salicampi]|uniref:Transcriptional regulator MntR n=1 Tax=Sedimentisphaera salicampi TaxID=1941349 RepID=A0A1W6LNL0_9BACT|nr:metal-dependent transcriptional regulator [Sedimentisphaera salicampi]ARN57368.1 Manganese transport regulator [Sedimentisphaera salicampi]
MEKKLTSGLEDYLEAIYLIQEKEGSARVKQIAEKMSVRAASVTGALQSLSAKGLINYTPYEHIRLTKKGRNEAVRVESRHRLLKRFFEDVLCVDEQKAGEAACKCEHGLHQEIYDKFTSLMYFLESPEGAELADTLKKRLNNEQ